MTRAQEQGSESMSRPSKGKLGEEPVNLPFTVMLSWKDFLVGTPVAWLERDLKREEPVG